MKNTNTSSTNSTSTTKERKDRLSETIRNKISIELTLNPKKKHLDIAQFYGISRQLVTKIAKENNLQRCKPRGLDGSYNYPERVKARDIVKSALRSGKIKQEKCEVCGDQNSHAHHDDYSKPLEIRWLCPKHHRQRHCS